MKRFPMRISLLGLAVVAASALVACTNSASSSGGAANTGTKTLNISVWGQPEDVDSIKAAAKGFQSAHSDVTLNFRTGDCGVDYAACKTLIAGKDMSDVLVTGTWNFNQMVNDGVLLNLTNRLQADGIKTTDFTPVAIDSDKAAKDGNYYGLPMGYNIQSLFYNKDMFAKAGLAEPDPSGNYTYDQLRDWAKKLTLDDKGNNADSPNFDPKHIFQWGYFNFTAAPISQGYDPVLWAYGGGVVDGPNRDQCDLEKPATLQAFQLLQDMMWNDHSAITPQLQQETPGYLRWVQGHVAMQQGSHEQVTLAAKQNPTLKYDMAALPKGPAGSATLAQVHTWAVYSGTKNADLAAKFVEYMATEGSGKQMGLIPAYKDRALGPDFLQAPGEPSHLKQAQLDPAAWPMTRTNIDPKGILSELEGQDGIGPALTTIITNKKPAADALKGSCSKVSTILGS